MVINNIKKTLKTHSSVIRFAAILVLAVLLPRVAVAQVDVTGSWTGFSFAGGNQYANSFSLVQRGTTVIGSATANGAPGVITGTINGNQITYHSEYATLNYSSDATGTTDGNTIHGTFLDSQGTSGTFTAQKAAIEALTPTSQLADPPVVQVKNKSVVLTLKKFSKAELANARNWVSKAKNQNLTIEYETNLKGSSNQRILTKKNVVNFKNLPSGSYSVTYRVSAVRNGKKVFSIAKSPVARFKIGR